MSSESPGIEPVELEIESLAAGGRGVARSEGLVWFVPRALPGDRVLARPHHRRSSFVEGRLVRRLSDSPGRREAPCALQSTCGGCPWMALDEAEQRHWKQTLVADALRRIGGTEVPVEAIRSSPRPLGYRNRVELSLGRGIDGGPALGYHAADPDATGLVDVERCPLQTDGANAVLASARRFLLPRAERWLTATENIEPFRLIVRSSSLDGRILVVVRETSVPFPDVEELAGHLREHHAELSGVVRLVARSGQRGGARVVPVIGRNWIEERIGSTTFRLPAASFVQVNPSAAEMLLDIVREASGTVDGRRVVDLYAGVGVYGIELARLGASVTACDADLDAVRCGRRTASHVAAGRVAFHHANAIAFLSRHLKAGETADLVLANPPRTGIGRGVAECIARLKPSRVVLVSCDPATLARDTSRLVKSGFVPRRAIPVDLFPQTAHVETVLVLSRG